MANGNDWNLGREMLVLPRDNPRKSDGKTGSYVVADRGKG